MGKIISGFAKKWIASQDITKQPCVFDMDILVSNNTGIVDFTIYNEIDAPTTRFSIKSGEFLDHASNKIIYGIIPNNIFNVKLCLSGEYTNYFINGEYLLSTSQVVSGRTSLSAIDFFTQNCTVDVDLRVSGKFPNCSFSGFSFNGSGSSGVGYVINDQGGLPFRIYSGISSLGDVSFTSDMSDVVTNKQLNVVKNFIPTTIEQLSDNIQNYEFTIYGNFGIFDSGINISTIYPITQNITNFELTSFSGLDNSIGTLNWQNIKGQSDYLEPLSGKLTISRVSGATGGNSFDSIFKSYVSPVDSDSFLPINYKANITGYEYLFDTISQSGIQYKLERLIIGSPITIKIDYSGYNTGFTYNITGY